MSEHAVFSHEGKDANITIFPHYIVEKMGGRSEYVPIRSIALISKGNGANAPIQIFSGNGEMKFYIDDEQERARIVEALLSLIGDSR
jgi:hypothetical protein